MEMFSIQVIAVMIHQQSTNMVNTMTTHGEHIRLPQSSSDSPSNAAP